MGREHALLLAKLGASVVVNDIDSTANDVVGEIEQAGGRAVASMHDISDYAEAANVIAAARDSFGHIHMVVSNAGISKNCSFADLTPERMAPVMAVNFYGAYNVLHHAWPHLLAQDYGRIVIVGSATAWYSQTMAAHYAASKGALLGLAKTLAMEGEPHDIKVNVLSPGAYTGMAEKNAPPDPAVLERMKRLMPAALVAPAVAWLLRRETKLNGQIIEAASGRVAHNFVASTKGYWKKDLSLADLEAHGARILDPEGHAVPQNTGEWTQWMMANIGSLES
jgi:NAD(P)-dependent dehydrogenase (short-subunit alcohol dehydrogenase family)